MVGENRGPKTSTVCVRGGTKNIGTGTWGTSFSFGQVSRCMFGVMGGECGLCVLYTICQVGRQHTGASSVQVKAV